MFLGRAFGRGLHDDGMHQVAAGCGIFIPILISSFRCLLIARVTWHLLERFSFIHKRVTPTGNQNLVVANPKSEILSYTGLDVAKVMYLTKT